jgi:hypothetical protein
VVGQRVVGVVEQVLAQVADQGWRRSRPVISGGGSMPSRRSTVGPTSPRAPPARSAVVSARTATSGTGLVVWAVCGPPVSGSSICSQLP